MSDVTRALIESALEIQEKRLNQLTDAALKERCQTRIDGLKRFLRELFNDPEPPDTLSDDEMQEMIAKLERAAGLRTS